MENLDQNDDFDKLPDVYIIFITETDAFGDGLPIHEMVLCDTATGKLNDDGKHLMYVNGEYKGNDDLGDLMHDFNCKNPAEMRIPEMAEATSYLKTTKEGQNEMCDIMQNLVNDAVDETKLSMIKNLHKSTGKSYEQVMNDLLLSDTEKKKYASALNESKEPVSVN